jgi:5-(carboxyamino)imidazole ribonucleotide synthase
VKSESRQSSSARVGIVGGGQLARMMAQAAIGLSVALDVFTDDADESTASLLPHHGLGGGDPASWLGLVDVVTFEHELLALDRVRAMESAGLVVRPSSAVMALSNKATPRRRPRRESSRSRNAMGGRWW